MGANGAPGGWPANSFGLATLGKFKSVARSLWSRATRHSMEAWGESRDNDDSPRRNMNRHTLSPQLQNSHALQPLAGTFTPQSVVCFSVQEEQAGRRHKGRPTASRPGSVRSAPGATSVHLALAALRKELACCAKSPALFSLILLLFACAPSSAAVLQRDWKSSGDGLLTFDNVNQREWLDLSETLLDDRFQGSGLSPIETRESRYQAVILMTNPGGEFAGFQAATQDDARALAESAGVDLSTSRLEMNGDAMANLQQLLGITLFVTSSNSYSIGMLAETGDLEPPNRLAAIFERAYRARVRFVDPLLGLQSNGPHAVMLYRDVPEPSPLALMSICLPVLILLRGYSQLLNRGRRRRQEAVLGGVLCGRAAPLAAAPLRFENLSYPLPPNSRVRSPSG